MEKIDLSIIILSYNTKNLTKKCLESVFQAVKELKRRRIEVIVVDNASTDGSVEEIENFKSEIEIPNCEFKIIFNKKNLGFAKGNNLGLKKASGKYILFLNSDTEIFPNALKETIDFMESDSKIGAMTPKTLLFSGKMDSDCHRGFPTPWASITYFLGLEKLFPKSKIFGQYHKFFLDLSKTHEIDAGFGTFMVVRKEVVNQVGGWDENYFFYGEDLDYFYRIKQAGWKVMFYSKPLLRHHKGASSGLRSESRKISKPDRQTRIKAAKASIQAMEIFYKKFYKDKYPRWITFGVLLGIKVKGFFRILFHKIR